MEALRRLSRAIRAAITGLLDDVTNHEAIAVESIRDAERSAAAIQAHRVECQHRVARLEREALELTEHAERWRARACQLAADPERAMECVRRLRAVMLERKAVLDALVKQRALLAALRHDGRVVAGRLDELRRRSARLSSRSALLRTSTEPGDVLAEWEGRLSREEAAVPHAGAEPVDLPSLSPAEDAALLRAELDRLLSEEGN